MRTYLFIFLIISVLFLSGCAGIHIDSAYDKSYSKYTETLFILANLPNKGWLKTKPGQSVIEINHANFQRFKIKMEEMFYKMDVNCICEVATGLELDDSKYSNQIKTLQPDTVLLIKCTAIELEKNTMTAVDFNLSFIDVASDKIFWRANVSIKTKGPLLGLQAYGDRIAEQITKTLINQLKKDKLMIFNHIEPL